MYIHTYFQDMGFRQKRTKRYIEKPTSDIMLANPVKYCDGVRPEISGLYRKFHNHNPCSELSINVSRAMIDLNDDIRVVET